MLWEPWQEVFGPGPSGMLAPLRPGGHDTAPEIAYGSIPAVEDSPYALVDTAIASGSTVLACARGLRERLGRGGDDIEIVAPFVSEPARRLLLSTLPRCRIHCIWHDEQISQDGRMIGPMFDIGEYAMGSRAPSLRWTGTRRG